MSVRFTRSGSASIWAKSGFKVRSTVKSFIGYRRSSPASAFTAVVVSPSPGCSICGFRVPYGLNFTGRLVTNPEMGRSVRCPNSETAYWRSPKSAQVCSSAGDSSFRQKLMPQVAVSISFENRSSANGIANSAVQLSVPIAA